VAAIILTFVLAAIGYFAGWWDKLPVFAALWRWLRSTGCRTCRRIWCSSLSGL
jgi:hypothetical protein